MVGIFGEHVTLAIFGHDIARGAVISLGHTPELDTLHDNMRMCFMAHYPYAHENKAASCRHRKISYEFCPRPMLCKNSLFARNDK